LIREKPESDEILPSETFPQQLARSFVENERQRKLSSCDIASGSAVRPLANRVHVAECGGHVTASTTQHRLGVDQIRIGETKHRIIGVREDSVRSLCATGGHIRELWRAIPLLEV